jgi:adenylate cyclase
MVEGEQIYGDGVNIAARLQGLADAGGIFISGTVYDQIETKLALSYEYLGEQSVKNIAKPVRVYRILLEPSAAAEQEFVLRQAQHERILPPAIALPVRPERTLSPEPVEGSKGESKGERQTSALPLPDKPSIAVLPFVNLSSDPEQEYFSDGITEDLITDLSRLSGLFVIARNSTFTDKGKAVKVEEVGRELGVRYVLEGSVRKAGSRVRITAQLVDATTSHHLWAERYDRELTDIFTLQDEIVQKIVTTLRLQLSLWEQGVLVRKATDNVEAYDYYLRGQEYLWRFTQEASAQARQMFKKAIDLEPQYAQAYAGLAGTYWRDWWQGNPNPQALDQAFELAQKAVDLEDSLPSAHMISAQVYVWKKQHEQAIVEGRRAIALDPNYDLGYSTLGDILSHAGQPEEALEMREKAMRLNPHYPPIYLNNIGYTYFLLGRYEEAIAALKKCLSLNPNLAVAHVNLAIVYAEAGQEEEARAEGAEILRLNPNVSLEGVRQRLPYRDPALSERFLDGLRKAGLK